MGPSPLRHIPHLPGSLAPIWCLVHCSENRSPRRRRHRLAARALRLKREDKTAMRFPRLHVLIRSALLAAALPLTGSAYVAAAPGPTPAGVAMPAPLVVRPAISNPHTVTCLAGWASLPYLNRGYVADQGCSGDRLVGDFTLTLGDTSGTKPVPAHLVLDTTHCDAKSHPGRCLYYMTGEINIPANTSLTIDSGVTLVDQNTGWC